MGGFRGSAHRVGLLGSIGFATPNLETTRARHADDGTGCPLRHVQDREGKQVQISESAAIAEESTWLL
jgi:hypothetical protein